METSEKTSARTGGKRCHEGKGLSFLPRMFRACEFRAFCRAGKEKNVEQAQILNDFKHYLQERSVPSYVADSMRSPAADWKKGGP
jgi:hypothetical protein